MAELSNAADLVGREPDERLLSTDLEKLPHAVGRPETIPPSRARGRIVGTGATLTGVSLILGVALVLFAVIDAVASGIDVGPVLAAIVGVVLISTHWGWVHVAELTANTLEHRSHAEALDRRRQWLAGIEPYTRYEVTTEVENDGSIGIVYARYRPIVSGSHAFTFVREVDQREMHPPDEPAAEVAERAEQLRRQAALATGRERQRYEIAADAYRMALADGADDEQRRQAQRAASEALSRQINSNLRDPPLVE